MLPLASTTRRFTFWLLGEWWGQDMGPLVVQSTMRYALWGFLAIVLGVQTIFGSFFLSMLGMSERTISSHRPFAGRLLALEHLEGAF